MARVLIGVCGLLYAAIIGFLAFVFLAGGGHGWVSPYQISLAGLVVIPFAAVALSCRRRILLLVAVIAGALCDLWLVIATAREGFGYFRTSFAVVPGFVVVWVLLWLLWQVAVIIPVLRGSADT